MTHTSLQWLSRVAERPADALDDWLDALTCAAGDLLGVSVGAAGRVYDARRGRTEGDYAVHTQESALRELLVAHRKRSAERIDFLQGGGFRLSSMQAVFARSAHDPYLMAMKRRFEDVVHDMWHFTVGDEEGGWLTLGLFTRAPLKAPWSPRSAAIFGRSLSRALRVQRRVSSLSRRLKVATRFDLRVALRRLTVEPPERVPVTPVDADRAHRIWCDLLDGRATLLDQHDHAGRRYVLAQPNPPRVEDPPLLTPRQAQVAALAVEGCSAKWIAATLELDRSTVASHLSEAIERLDLPSRAALAGAFTSNRGALEADVVPVPRAEPSAHELAGGCVLIAFDLAPDASAAAELALASLTAGQRPIVRLALAGYSDAAIAAKLGRSRHTVSNQLRRAYARLGVSTRVELCARIGVLVHGERSAS